MHEVELIFIREDLFTYEPNRKVVIGRFKEPPASGDYLIVEEDLSVNEWAIKYDEEFMAAIKGGTYLFKERIYTGKRILFNLEQYDNSNSKGGLMGLFL